MCLGGNLPDKGLPNPVKKKECDPPARFNHQISIFTIKMIRRINVSSISSFHQPYPYALMGVTREPPPSLPSPPPPCLYPPSVKVYQNQPWSSQAKKDTSIKKETAVNFYDHTRQPRIPASDIYRLLNSVPGACQNSGEEFLSSKYRRH